MTKTGVVLPVDTDARPQLALDPARGPLLSGERFFVVGIGASAGGLDACRKLLDSLPAETGMAFIIVQHLDPNHESMMVDLLATHTQLTVAQATNGMPIAPHHIYLIPPGTYLSVKEGTLRLSAPLAPHGARLPFDFLLQTLADDYRERAICVVLSGTGTDGSIGLRAIRQNGGYVIAQEPKEAGYDGMPRNAIATGEVNQVLHVADIPHALIAHSKNGALATPDASLPTPSPDEVGVASIIALLRAKTTHDFTLYKPGTLQRRIERRMGMLSIERGDTTRYLEVLSNDPEELKVLAKDLLINVTSFFRDTLVFKHLEDKCIPELIKSHSAGQSLRIWCAGCSTGEEAYSLAMLFREAITAAKRNIKLQVFASDVDSDAISVARNGLYPETIVTDVSKARLARFFSKEEHSFRVSPELRASVVFTVQDVLADPPFSRLDLVSCRNLMIYLGPEAQKKVLSAFHFALREGGILLLGTSETVGAGDTRFALISKAEHLYRHVGPVRPGDLGIGRPMLEQTNLPARAGFASPHVRQAAHAELCRRMVLEEFAPAAMLIDSKNDCLFSMGPTHHYLRMAPGHPTHDVLAMAHQELRTKLRSALQQASAAKTRVALAGTRTDSKGDVVRFDIDVQTVLCDGEELRLICFVDEHTAPGKRNRVKQTPELPRVAELELELDALRTELQGAIHNLEISSEEQKAVNEEALSVNEEFQSTNEELLTSKEELQSLNEELTALNSQLQETLERQRTTANDLQNVLYSTDVATLFLDVELNIRFFTPATKSLFKVIASDIGRPLADLASLAEDIALTGEARSVLQTGVPVEQEIETRAGTCFMRRILPYKTHNGAIEGVVITFTDITERKRTRKALEVAKLEAERANLAKSRFLAAASHDLRQPLQSLVLLQGLLAKSVQGEQPQRLLARFDETVTAMSGMLNTLLDINQIEAGVVKTQLTDFAINDVMVRLRDDFLIHAEAQGLELIMVPCSLLVRSDPHLLQQMLRNLLSNALKYTKTGRVLIGCRRHDDFVSIEVWDTGIGVADAELKAIFDEYHQINNAARERVHGLGLGLSIVQRLGHLLGVRVQVRSQLGKGSVFAIDVPVAPRRGSLPSDGSGSHGNGAIEPITTRKGSILVVEDDPDARELLALFLTGEGHHVLTAANGPDALAVLAKGKSKPDILLVDFNLPRGMNGVTLVGEARAQLGFSVGAVILTGDVSGETFALISGADCTRLSKPMQVADLAFIVTKLLSAAPTLRARETQSMPRQLGIIGAKPVVHIVDDDDGLRGVIATVLEESGYDVKDYATCEAFLAGFEANDAACLLIDAYLPGMTGLELLAQLRASGSKVPAIMITGSSDVPIAVEAMKAGAFDFIEKPVGMTLLLERVEHALDHARGTATAVAGREQATRQIAALTAREREIMDLVLAGHASKVIAADLGISQRTVENHRSAIMTKTGAKSLPDLVRLALASQAR